MLNKIEKQRSKNRAEAIFLNKFRRNYGFFLLENIPPSGSCLLYQCLSNKKQIKKNEKEPPEGGFKRAAYAAAAAGTVSLGLVSGF